MNLSCFMLQALGLQKARVFILDKKFKPSQVLYLLVGAWLSSAPYVILTSKYLAKNACKIRNTLAYFVGLQKAAKWIANLTKGKWNFSLQSYNHSESSIANGRDPGPSFQL